MKKLIPVILALFFAQTSLAQLPTFGLTAWYPFCRDVNDHSGNGFDMATVNTVYALDHTTAALDHAYSFNGSNSSMNYSTFFPATGDFSYSCWIFPTAPQASILWYNGDKSSNGFGLVMNDGTAGLGMTPGNKISIWWGGYGTMVQPPSFVSPTVSIGNWHHLVLIRFGNSYQLWVDDVSAGYFIPNPPTDPPIFNALTNVFSVGLNTLAGTDPYQGLMDDIAIYSRSLAAVEVHRLYALKPNIEFNIYNRDTFLCGPVTTKTLTTDPYLSPATGYTYSWSVLPTGGPLTVFATTPTVTVTPPYDPSQYIVRVSRPYYCDGLDTAKIKYARVHSNIGPLDTTFCSGASAMLVTDTTGVSSYLWNTGDTTNSINVTTSGTYWVHVDSNIILSTGLPYTCTGGDTVNVTVAPPVVVTLGNDSLLCQGGTVTMSSSNSYTAPVYLWGGPAPVGGQITSTATATVTGTYWLQVTDGPCSAADTQNVTIIYDTISLYAADTESRCKGQPYAALASGNPAVTYQWTPTTGIPVSNIPNPIITADTSGYYFVTGTLGVCHVKDSFYLDVQPNPKVFLGGNRHVCQFDSLRIIPTVTPSWYTKYSYSWTPAGIFDDATDVTVIATPKDTAHVVLTVTTPHGCTAADSMEIFWHPGNFDSGYANVALCPGDSVQIFPYINYNGDTSGVTATYVYHPGHDFRDSTVTNAWLLPETNQDIQVIATSQYGCRDTNFFNVIVRPNAIIYLGDSVTLHAGDSVQLGSPGSNIVTYEWFPPEGLDNPYISNPTAKPLVNTVYKVHGVTEYGCAVDDSIKIRVTPTTLLDLPNAFTPGSAYNPTFNIIKKGAAALRYFRIYNRWGGVVFQTTNIDEGWNGMANGVEQPFGVYVYDIEAVTDRGKVFHVNGNVTLIR